MKESNTISRRDFLEVTTAGAAGLLLASSNRFALGAARGPNDLVNAGVIGAGAQGSQLIRNLAILPTARITAICDIFETNLKKGVELAGSSPRTFIDYRKMLGDKDLHAVIIALPLF